MQMPSPRSGRQSAPPQNFSDVYSQSHTDAELAENMRSYFARKVPAPIWLSLSAMQIVAGLVSLFIGPFIFKNTKMEYIQAPSTLPITIA